MLRIEVIQGVDRGSTLSCSGRRPRMIGRASKRMQVSDHKCSRHQARVWVEDGRWWIRDLDSRHGTYVNSTRIDQPTPLTSGDRVRMGNLVGVVREAALPRDRGPAPEHALAPEVPLDLPERGPCLALLIEGRRDGRPSPLARQVLRAGERTWIGRKGAPLTLDDSRVSARHARLDVTVDGWLITDLGSSRGTFVNGWRIDRPTPLSLGDRLWLGRLRLSVVAAMPLPTVPALEAPAAHEPVDVIPEWEDLPADEPTAFVGQDEATDSRMAPDPLLALADAEAAADDPADVQAPPPEPASGREPTAPAAAAPAPSPPQPVISTRPEKREQDPTAASPRRPATPAAIARPDQELANDPVTGNMPMIFPHFKPVRVDPHRPRPAKRRGVLRRLLPEAVVRILP